MVQGYAATTLRLKQNKETEPPTNTLAIAQMIMAFERFPVTWVNAMTMISEAPTRAPNAASKRQP
jgi:hypothetical protein